MSTVSLAYFMRGSGGYSQCQLLLVQMRRCVPEIGLQRRHTVMYRSVTIIHRKNDANKLTSCSRP